MQPNSSVTVGIVPLVRPVAVCIEDARPLLGGKAVSGIYRLIGRGQLQAVKDGKRTLVTLASIERYMSSLPLATQIKKERPAQPYRPTVRRVGNRQWRA